MDFNNNKKGRTNLSSLSLPHPHSKSISNNMTKDFENNRKTSKSNLSSLSLAQSISASSIIGPDNKSNMGWLYGSTIQPHKAKDIKVESTSMVGLKAQLFQHEQQIKSGIHIPRTINKKRDKNLGVEKRIRTDLLNNSSQQTLKLKAKAKIYDELVNNNLQLEESSLQNQLIDFDRKILEPTDINSSSNSSFSLFDIDTNIEPSVDDQSYYKIINSLNNKTLVSSQMAQDEERRKWELAAQREINGNYSSLPYQAIETGVYQPYQRNPSKIHVNTVSQIHNDVEKKRETTDPNQSNISRHNLIKTAFQRKKQKTSDEILKIIDSK